MKLRNCARTEDACVDTGLRPTAHPGQEDRWPSTTLIADTSPGKAYQEWSVADLFRAQALEATIISVCRRAGEAVAVIRCVEDCPGLRSIETLYGAEVPPETWLLPELDEPPREFLARVIKDCNLDVLVVQNAVDFAWLCGRHPFQDAEPLWTELSAAAETENCRVVLIRRDNEELCAI